MTTLEEILQLPREVLAFLRFTRSHAVPVDGEEPSLVLVVSQEYIIAGFSNPGIYYVTRRRTGWTNPDTVLKLIVSMDREGEQVVGRILSTGEIRIKGISGVLPKDECIIYSEAINGFNSERILEARVNHTTLEAVRILEDEIGYVILDPRGSLVSYKRFRVPLEVLGGEVIEFKIDRALALPQVFSVVHEASRRFGWRGMFHLRITRVKSEYSFYNAEYLLFLGLDSGDYLYLETVKPFDYKWMAASWDIEYARVKPDPFLASIIRVMLKGRGWRKPPVMLTRKDRLIIGKVWGRGGLRVMVYDRPVYESEQLDEPVGVLVPDVLLKDVVARLTGIGVIPITKSVDSNVVNAIIGVIARLESGELETVMEEFIDDSAVLSRISLEGYNLGWTSRAIHEVLAKGVAVPVTIIVHRDPVSGLFITVASFTGGKRFILVQGPRGD